MERGDKNKAVWQERCQAWQGAELMTLPTLGPGPGTRAGDQGRGRGCAAGLRLRLGPGPAQGLRLAHSIKHKHEDLDSIFRTYIKLSVVVHTCNPSARGRGGGGGDTGNFLVSH